MASTDPILELVGWKAEPLLLSRLPLHVAEATVELVGLSVCICLAESMLTPSMLFVRLLTLPICLVGVKLVWALNLIWAYYQVRGAEFAVAVRRMGRVHTRACWSCSAAIFTCFSCVLMVWHSIMMLLMLCYEYQPKEALAVRFLMATSGLFVATNWAFWRDFVRHFADHESEDTEHHRIHTLYLMYKAKVIKVARFRDLPATAKVVQPCCAVCLEDFTPQDSVALLPCSHIFHPTCANRWIREDWRCPFRCQLEVEGMDLRQGVPSRRGQPPTIQRSQVLPHMETEDVESNVEMR